MSKREKFLAFVRLGAISQDSNRKSKEITLIMLIAGQIPEEQIPEDAMNAADAFLAFCRGVSKRPRRWMLGRRKG